MEHVTRAIILSGWAIMLLSCFVIVGAAAWVFVQTGERNADLLTLASMAFTFLCTTLPKMVSDLLIAYKPPAGTQS
jgi:hypothetical protein